MAESTGTENHLIHTFLLSVCRKYTKGKDGNPPKEISQLLHYMEHTTTENAVNDSLKSIDRMVNAVKHDKEVSLNYMKMIEWEKMLIRQGRKEEQANTERERLRAVFAEERANHAEQEIQILKEQLEAERKKIH